MKRILTAAIALFAIVVVSGCKKTPAEILINGSPVITISDGATSGSFTFTSNRDWTVVAAEGWIHVNPSSGSASDNPVTVTVTCDPNNSPQSRSAKVTISAGGISQEITVNQPSGVIPVTGISVEPAEATLMPGETIQLTATVTPDKATDKTVVWSVEVPTKRSATPIDVSSDGLVTANEAGQWYAVATCGGVSASCLVTVRPEPITLYVYDNLGWGSLVLYGWDEDSEEVEAYSEYDPVGEEEVFGISYYKFVVPGEWSNPNYGFCFSDSEDRNWTASYGGLNFEPGCDYFLCITGPFDEDGDASLELIEYPEYFEPVPYVVPEPELPAGTIYYENFDSDGCLDGWTFIDSDGDSYNWRLASTFMGNGSGHNNSYDMLVSQSYINEVGSLHPDNWAFTPAISLGKSNTLSLWLCAQDASYCAEHIAVYMTEQIPASGDIASGCTLLMDGTIGSQFTIYTKVQSEWQQFDIPIPAEFNGKTVYFGFRHFITTDMFYINMDDITVTSATGAMMLSSGKQRPRR